MAYEMNDNSGSLFANKKKETDRHPDRTGSAKIDGVEYWVSGWVKQDATEAATWFKLSIRGAANVATNFLTVKFTFIGVKERVHQLSLKAFAI